MFFNRVNNGKACGPAMGGNYKRASIYLAAPLYKIPVAPTPKVVREKKMPSKISRPHLTDEQAIEVIKRRRNGTPLRVLSEETGFSAACIANICNGINRGHLLRMVEEGYDEPMLGFKGG